MSQEMTLSEAREMLRAGFQNGTDCPCCGQFVRLYKRQITSAMAVVPTFLTATNLCSDFSKLALWDLVEKMPKAVRADGSRRVGMYKITETGNAYVEGLTIDKYRYEFNRKRRHPENPDKTQHTIKDALKKKFDYNELMGLEWSMTWGGFVPRDRK